MKGAGDERGCQVRAKMGDKTYKWELIKDGYHREQRYVEWPSGKIVGGTRGTVYENDGWYAGAGETLGVYVTEDLAKRAVEAALAEKKRGWRG